MVTSSDRWKAEISRRDEYMGKQLSYPNAFMRVHISDALEQQNEVFKNSNYELQTTIKNTTAEITGTLENGFNLLYEENKLGFDKLNSSVDNLEETNRNGFSRIASSLNFLNSTLSWGFSKIIEINRQNNLLLNDIVQLLNIPDIEKERKLYIERGLEFLKKSSIDISFLDDSKQHFLNAHKIYNTDYYVLYNLGIIHYFSSEHLDFNMAKEYFLKSAKYANADILYKPVKYSTHQSSFKNKINPKTIATYSFLYAARCSYELNQYNEALTLAKKAYSISPEILEVIYDNAKFNAINRNITDTLSLLTKAISIDRYVTLKIINDMDLIKNKEVNTLLLNLKKEKHLKSLDLFNTAAKMITKESTYYNDLQKAYKLVDEGTFLSSMSAIDILE